MTGALSRELTRAEESTLLYLETCAVDHLGIVEGMRMSVEDGNNVKQFIIDGLVLSYGRLPATMLRSSGHDRPTAYVQLSDMGHATAAVLRKRRAETGWKKTKEKLEPEAL